MALNVKYRNSNRCVKVATVIQKALAAYKENQKDHSYPLNISDWQILREIAGSQGINLPDTSLAAKIKTFRYESVNGSDYLLTIDVDIPEDTYRDRFLLVSPDEVTRHKNRPWVYSSTDDTCYMVNEKQLKSYPSLRGSRSGFCHNTIPSAAKVSSLGFVGNGPGHNHNSCNWWCPLPLFGTAFSAAGQDWLW